MRDIVKHKLNSNTMYMGAATYPKSARSWKQVNMHVYCVKYYIVLWNCNSHFVSSITSSMHLQEIHAGCNTAHKVTIAIP